MSEARDVIARAVAIARGDDPMARKWAALSGRDRDTAELGLRRVVAAGYRIAGPEDRVIGKGELYPVTVARIEEMADAMTDEYDVAAITAETEEMTVACRHAEKALRRLAAAIRNLGEKA